MPRLLLIPLVLILLLVLAVAVLIPLLLDEDKILELATTALHEQTGATLTVDGETRLSVFPTLGISLSDAAITLPDKTEPDLRVRSLQIGVQLLPLLSSRVEVDTFALDGLSLRIETSEKQNPVDTSNYNDKQLDDFYDRRHQSQAEAGEAAGAEAALAVPLALKVKHLKISDARLELVDPSAAQPTLLELVSLEASDLNLAGQPMPLDMTVRLLGKQPIEVALNGHIRLDQQSQMATLDELNVAVSGATNQTLKLVTHGSIDLSRQIADLQLELELGETRGDGTLRYANFESPQIDASLQLNLFDPALLALVGPEAATTDNEGGPGRGDEPLPLAALRTIDTRAVLDIGQVRSNAHSINNVHAILRAADGVVQIKELTGELHGGRLEAQATFNGKHNTATLDTRGSIREMDIAAALAAAESEVAATGSATLEWQLKSRGRTANELTAALSGPIKLDTREVVLQGTSVEHLICQTVALTNQEKLTATFPDHTRFQALSADIQMSDGKAALQPLRAELSEIALSGRGDFNLLTEDFSATFSARLSPGLEYLDHACRVSKRLTAIDWPVNCKGNVSTDPARWCAVDAEKIIRDMAVHEGRRKLEKKANKFLNKLFK